MTETGTGSAQTEQTRHLVSEFYRIATGPAPAAPSPT